MVSGQRLKRLKQEAAVHRRARLRGQAVPPFRRALAGVLVPELRAARGAVRRAFGARDASDFDDWIEEFYPGHEERIARELSPLVLRYGEEVVRTALEEIGGSGVSVEQFGELYTRGLANRWTNESVAQLRQIVRDETEDVGVKILTRLDAWKEVRASWTAEREATKAGGAFSKHAYVLNNVERLVWRAIGDSCPLCTRMDGRTVQVTQFFMEEGDELEAEAEDGPRRIVTHQKIGHPPLHGLNGRGGVCDCVVAASL